MSSSLKLIIYAVLRYSQARKKNPDGTQFTKQSRAMNAILKYHLQDGNALTHRGKGKAVAAVPQYIQSYGMQQCYSKQLWDQALEMGLTFALRYISEIFSPLLYQPPPIHPLD